MSNSTQVSDANLAALRSFLTANQIVIASAALYYYEWLVTFDQEITHIWARRWTVATWIFALNRYSTFFDLLGHLLPTTNEYEISQSCTWVFGVEVTFELLQLLISALFTALRAYALSSRNVWIFLVVFLFSVYPFITNMLLRVHETILFSSMAPFTVCESVTPFSDSVTLGQPYKIRQAVADCLVLAITWNKAIGAVRAASRHNLKVPLNAVLIRDGTFFFLALLALNIYEILSNNIPSLSLSTSNSLLTPLNAIIISRFMLNLRQVAEVEQSSVSAGTAHRSTLLFNADVIVGNMGESLNFDVNSDEEDADADTDIGRNDREGIEDLSDGPVGMTVEANEAPHDSSGENVIEFPACFSPQCIVPIPFTLILVLATMICFMSTYWAWARGTGFVDDSGGLETGRGHKTRIIV
ncbi:hypothetical protein BC629DRAFT_1594680 [Irpex lacteus]|nr:hypothetical protein BC629DRAFT_1594680 [Irpex lacteus]